MLTEHLRNYKVNLNTTCNHFLHLNLRSIASWILFVQAFLSEPGPKVMIVGDEVRLEEDGSSDLRCNIFRRLLENRFMIDAV